MKMNKVAKNTVWIVGCKLVQSLLSLLIGMFTARYLGPSNYGLVNYAASIVAFFTPLMQLGLNNILVRELLAQPEQEGRTLGTALTLSGLSSLLCVAGVGTFVALMNPGERDTLIVSVLYSLLLVFQSVELLQYWFHAKLLSKFTSLASLAAYLLVSVYRIWLLVTRKEIFWFAVSQALDFGIIAGALMILYRRNAAQPLAFSRETAKQLLHKSRYYILANLLVVVFGQADRILLKLLVDEAAVGYYTAAATISGVCSFVFLALIDSYQPVILSHKRSGDEEAFQNSMGQLYCLVIYLSLGICVGIFLFADIGVKLIYGDAYAQSARVLRILVWYTTFSYLGAVRNVWILAEEAHTCLWRLNLAGSVANLALNLLLIPLWGVYGAAVAALITQIFTNVIMGYVLKPIRRNNRLMLRGLDLRLLDLKRWLRAK